MIARRKPASPERRAQLSEQARRQHAERRGFEIPPEMRPDYYRLQKTLRKKERIWAKLGLM